MDISKLFLMAGAALIIIGLLYRLGFGRLPGDINIQHKGVFFSFPIVSSIILSIILTLVINYFLNRQ